MVNYNLYRKPATVRLIRTKYSTSKQVQLKQICRGILIRILIISSDAKPIATRCWQQNQFENG